MCGIIAYVGRRDAQPILIDGLKRLEYRGYDSAGMATIEGGNLDVLKSSGRIAKLEQLSSTRSSASNIGISHTRWATHGEPTDENAHPHLDKTGDLAIVHNGVIENYHIIKKRLIDEGHSFESATDTEVLAHLVGSYYETSTLTGEARLVDAIKRTIPDLQGTYGIAAIHKDLPDLIVGARRGSPLVVGLGENENLISSDANALLRYTTKVIYLQDFDLVTIRPDSFEIVSLTSEDSSYEISEIEHKAEDAEKGDFPHFMLKEIFEQPIAIENAIRGRLDPENCSAKLGGLDLSAEQLRNVDRVLIVACGTALHAGMVGEHMIESLVGIPVEVDHASEFRYRNCPLDRNTLVLVVSQSGETIDTLGAMREAQRKGYRALGICNSVGSTIARESDGGVYMHAGPEIGVAATKSFLSQVTIFGLIALLLGRMRFTPTSMGEDIVKAFEKLPGQVTEILKLDEQIQEVAKKYKDSKSVLFLGRQANFPIALEGALKLKEISYIHAEGYPSGELKHGVIALIEENTPTIIIAPNDSLYEKNISSLQEIKARNGKVIVITTPGDHHVNELADDVIVVPETIEMLQPALNVVPLQLLSYHIAVELGRDVDKPRNLAKSVTVE